MATRTNDEGGRLQALESARVKGLGSSGPRPRRFSIRMQRSIAERLPYSSLAETVSRFPLLGRWASEYAAGIPYFEEREALYEPMNERIGNGPITYLEFGVYTGDSLRSWCRLNSHPKSRFVGFDTFTGLPEDWHKGFRSGHFDTGGAVPSLSDPRVRFVKGLFQDTLPGFLRTFPFHGSLIINNDSDLYSSTLFMLCALDSQLPGAVIFFDEFSDVLHEFRAFHDYLGAFRRRYTVLAAAGPYYNHVVV